MPRKSKPKKAQHGGPRQNSGRPRKEDQDNYTQITCVLRNDTVAKLRAGGGKFFGSFLQSHLDRFQLPTHEDYVAMKDGKQVFTLIKRRRIPVITGRITVRPVRHVRPKTKAQLLREKLRKEFVAA
jgi:hypothetical protein